MTNTQSTPENGVPASATTLAPSIVQMLETGQACGLHTVEEAFQNYMNHYDCFFLISDYANQLKKFMSDLVEARLVTKAQLPGSHTFPSMSIDAALILMKLDELESSGEYPVPKRLHISELAVVHWEWIESMSWHNKTPLENLALVASEVGEAINECRGAIPTQKFRLELADVVLRTMDLAQSLNIDLEQAILDKMAINKSNGNFKNRLV